MTANDFEGLEGALLEFHPKEAGDLSGLDRAEQVVRVIWPSNLGAAVTGGRSLPKTGSDGGGYALARGLGHSLTPRIFPGLVPLTLPRDHVLCTLSGLSAPATLEARTAEGRRLASFTGSTLCTHFGLSGPAVLDISRYFIAARLEDGGTRLVASWLPGEAAEDLEVALRGLGPQTIGRFLTRRLPERLARALCAAAAVDGSLPGHQLSLYYH